MKGSEKLIAGLSHLDIFVFLSILILTFISAIYAYKKQASIKNTQKNYLEILLMGRRLTLPLFTCTLVATWYGGIFGVTRITYESGIYSFVTQGFFWYLSYIIFAFFLVHKISRYQAVTLPEQVGMMFGENSKKLSALFNILNVIPIAYIISLGIFLQILFQIPLAMGMGIGIGAVSLYAILGGFRAVVYSDVIQFFVMCLSVFFVVVFSFSELGGISYLNNHLPPQHFEVTGGHSWAETLVWGLIALSTLVDPNFYQRVFAAEDPKVAKKGILISTFIWFLFDCCTTLGALYARAHLPDVDPNQAYLLFSMEVLPDGLRGFFLAGILATILSTMDSYIFIAGTTLSHDLFPLKSLSTKKLHYLGIVIVSLVGFCLALVFEGNIKTVWKTLGSYSSACLLAPILLGHIYPRQISDRHFVRACIGGVVAVTLWRSIERQGFLAEIDEIYIGILVTTVYLLWKKRGNSELSQS